MPPLSVTLKGNDADLTNAQDKVRRAFCCSTTIL
jgi:hypothetical protein